MQKITMFDSALQRVQSQRAWRRQVAVSVGVDPSEVDTLVSQKDERVVNSILALAGMGGNVRVVDTNAKKFIEKIVRAAAWDKRLYALFGKTGIGKTIAIKSAITTIQETVAYVRVNLSNAKSAVKLNYDVYRSLHLAVHKREPNRAAYGYVHTAFRLMQDIVEKNRSVIIFDEAQRLSDNGFEVLRDIYDETNASLVVVGSTAFAERMSKKKIGDEIFGQFLRRIDDRYELPTASPGDVRVFLGAYGVEVDKSESRHIAKKIGTYGDIDTLARAMARIAGTVEEGEMTWRKVGAGQIIDAIDSIITVMEAEDESEGKS